MGAMSFAPNQDQRRGPPRAGARSRMPHALTCVLSMKPLLIPFLLLHPGCRGVVQSSPPEEPGPSSSKSEVPSSMSVRFSSLRWGLPYSNGAWISGGYKVARENDWELFADYLVRNLASQPCAISMEGDDLRGFLVQVKCGETWEEIPISWCGTGSMPVWIPPQDSTVVSFPIPRDYNSVRFGVSFVEKGSKETRVTWTNELIVRGL